jgi:amino acid adenylation domain-containing protein
MIKRRAELQTAAIPASWNGMSTNYPKDQCIHTLFARQAALAPDAIALEFGESTITYSALQQMAHSVAGALRDLQIASGGRVALVAERSPGFIAGLLGILQAGGVYVPVDLNYPDERVQFLCRDADVQLVLGSGKQKAAVKRLSIAAAFVDLNDLKPANGSSVSAHVGPEDPAYVLYTSGSTGTPKGVVVGHRAVVRLVMNTNYVTIEPGDVFLQLAPASFDASTFEIFAPLLNGARLAIAPPGELSLAGTGELIANHHVSTLWLTAGLFHAMVDERPEALRKVRQLLAGGDVLSPAHVHKALSAMDSGCIVNGYGPTENTTFTCCYRVTRETSFSGSVPIGTPIANSSVYILDSELQPAAVGEIGEIFIGGDGLALGYLNRPELEREKFVAHPFAAGERLYRSGDLGRFLPSGDIEFCGRTDDQVKIRGYRVELGEIEAAVMRVEQVAQALVVAVADASGDKSLSCHYVVRPGHRIDSEQIRTHLDRSLPAYMLPAHYREWDAFPLTANGKVDRRSLLEPSVAPQAAAETAELLGPVEQTLLEMFRGLVSRNDISVDDDFFAVGGHSLAAARLFAKIEERFGKRLPLATLFEAPSVRQLAAILENQAWSPAWSPLVPIRATGACTPIFLVHAIGGNVLSYKHLHAHLPPDQPIYAFQAVALKDGRMNSTTIEEVAASYVAELRLVQPHGPYYIGGFSSGGIVAYEMAQQLTRAGQRVATLLLFDSYVDASPMALLRTLRLRKAAARAWRSMAWNLRFFRRTDTRSFLARKIHNFFMNARIVLYQSLSSAAHACRIDGPGPFLTVEEAFLLALDQYVLEPYEGSAVLLRTEDSFYDNPENAVAWGRLVKRLDVLNVPGDHDSMFQQPHVRVLADTIAGYLENRSAA